MSQQNDRSRPTIAINCDWLENRARVPALMIRMNYLTSIIQAGGTPLVVPVVDDPALLESYLDRIAGLLLIGGRDISPARYGASAHPLTVPLPAMREEFDLRLVRTALDRGVPVMAICLGCQLLNVAMGGTLHQDVASAFPDSPLQHTKKIGMSLVSHHVRIMKDTQLFQIIGKEEIETNSSHHQSVNQLGDGLVASAFAEDGVIEAVESTRYPFALGVQWHPEYLADQEDHVKLFQALVEAARPHLR